MPSSKTGPRIAIIQHPPVFLNLEKSLARACDFIEEASCKGADMAVFPETWIPGYPVWLDYSPKAALWNHEPAKALYKTLVENSMTIPGKHLDRLLTIALEKKIHVIMGIHEREGGTLYNTMIFLSKDGKGYKIHRKLIPTYQERLLWGMGDGSTLNVMETEYGNVGGLVCWEHWMPLARAAMHSKRETIHIAQWPSVRELHQMASRHYAFEGQCFVVAAGSTLTKRDVIRGFESLENKDERARELLQEIPGDEESLLLKGGSAIIAPNADYVEKPLFDKSCIIYGEVEIGRISEGNLFMDSDGHYSRPDVFRLEVDTRPKKGVTFTRDKL